MLAGGGAALLSELVVAQDVASRALVEIPTAGLDFGRTLRVVWRTGTRPVGAAAALVGIRATQPRDRTDSHSGMTRSQRLRTFTAPTFVRTSTLCGLAASRWTETSELPTVVCTSTA